MPRLYSRLYGLMVAAVVAVACAPVAESAPTSNAEVRVAASQSPDLSTGQGMSQTRVRFTVGDTEIIVRTADNPTSRDFVSMLPLTMTFRDFNAMEKIGDLPRRLATQGSTGSPPANGDLICFVPWGNLGFFYNAARRDASFDHQVIPIGTVEFGYDRLSELESGPVRVEVIP
jgi:hypothetical protein